jgi:small-conductance mechanosensitive channel
MIRFIGILLTTTLVITLASQELWAQNEDLETILKGTAKEDTQTSNLPEPNPLNLQSNWWQYFDGSEDQLDKKITSFLSNLNALSDSIRDKNKERSDEYIPRIRASLKVLVDIKKAPTQPITDATAFKESYTLDELLNINRLLRELESIYKTEFPAFKENQKATKALAGKIDTLQASYNKLNTANQNKLNAGLEIIANRLAWFVSTQKEPIQKGLLELQDIRIKKLAKEIEFAQLNLTVSENELDTIEKEIDKQQSTYKSTQKKFVEAQSLSLENVEEDLTGYLKSSLLKQKTLLAKINSTREEAKLNYFRTKKSVATLSLQGSKDPTGEIVEQYKNNESYLKEVQKKSDEWRSSLIKEINNLIETSVADDSTRNNNVVEKITNERIETVKGVAQALQELDNSVVDLSFFNNVVRDQLTKTQGPLFKLRSDSTYTFGELWKGTKKIFGKSLFSIGDVPVTLSDILSALIIVIIAYIISRIVQNILARISGPSDGRSSPVFYTLSRLSHYIIIILGIIIALASIGLNFTNLAIIAGALSVGIGFGLQSIVNNFVSGIIVLFEQNIKVGDYVQLDSGMNGVVKGINVRSTVITTLDNLDIIVPNSELVTAKVVNYTMSEPMFRIHVPFGVAYGSDKAIVEKAGLEAAKKVEVTYDDGAKRRPQVWLVEFGDSSLNFELIVWVVNKKGNHATPGSWRALYIWEIETALQKHGIEIPFPQRDLHLKSGFSTSS